MMMMNNENYSVIIKKKKMKVINSVSVNAEFENSSFYSDVNAIKK